jgi:endoglucanase
MNFVRKTIIYFVISSLIFTFLISCNVAVSLPTEQSKETAAILPPTSPPPPTRTVRPTTSADEKVFEQNQRLGRGINLGNMLEAPKEGEWGLSVEEEYFDWIKEAGFQSVRIPIRWSAHTEKEAPYTIDPQFFSRIDQVVEQALQRDLAVIINIHHYEEINEEPRPQKERFLAIWEQIAKRYQDQPDHLFFEILNEPQGTLAAVSWNEYASEAIQTIRQTNPQRTLIVGPGDWNSINGLPGLLLPENDRNIIVTVHYYLPFQFTHQGAEWVDGSDAYLGTTWNGSEAEKLLIVNDFDRAVKWAERAERPMFLGEFGAYYKADMDSRARWTEYVARQAEERGWSWAYWEFGSGFGAFDPQSGDWRVPLFNALLPPK